MTFEEFKEYKKELLALLPRINTQEGSEAHVRLWKRYYEGIKEDLQVNTPTTAKVLDDPV